jgi:hypothetical protein
MKRSIFPLLLVLFSCVRNRNVENEVLYQTQDTSFAAVKADTSFSNQSLIFKFDASFFKNSADSLLSLINGKKTTIRLQIDTIKNLGGYEFYPFVESASWTIRYRFKPKPDKSLGFAVYESHFPDKQIANNQFHKTKESGKDSLEIILQSGLSYAYDFVVMYENKIFALNAPCTFANFNYRKLLSSFKKSFRANIPPDTIICRCGVHCQ